MLIIQLGNDNCLNEKKICATRKNTEESNYLDKIPNFRFTQGKWWTWISPKTPDDRLLEIWSKIRTRFPLDIDHMFMFTLPVLATNGVRYKTVAIKFVLLRFVVIPKSWILIRRSNGSQKCYQYGGIAKHFLVAHFLSFCLLWRAKSEWVKNLKCRQPTREFSRVFSILSKHSDPAMYNSR